MPQIGLGESPLAAAVPLGTRSWFDVKASGATGDGTTDDTVAVQAAITAAITAGGGIVFFPAGTYLLNTSSGTIGAGISYALYINNSKISLIFSPAAVLKTTADLNLIAFGGALKPGLGTFSTYYIGDPANATYYAINAATSRGLQTITTATAAHAGNFAASDWIHIRTGSLNDSTVTEPDAEINQVVSADAGTGVIKLRYPLAKGYAQEYFIAGTTGKTSTAVTANLATFGVAKITDRTITDISIEGLTIDTSATTKSAIVGRGGLARVAITGLRGVCGGSPMDVIECRGMLLRDWDLQVKSPDSGAYRWLVDTATTMTDVLIENVRGRATGGRQLIGHFHEGSANVIVRGMQITSEAGADDGNPLSVRARAYNHLYEDIDIVSGGTVSAYVDDTCTGGVTLVRPRVVIGGDATKGLRVSPLGAKIIDPHADTRLIDDVHAWNPPLVPGDKLLIGQAVVPRLWCPAAISITSGVMRLAYLTAETDQPITKLESATAATLAGATPTLCRMGLYLIDSSGNGTLVAACASDTAMWSAANTVYSKAIASPSSYTPIPGQRYAFACILVTAAATPTLVGLTAGVAGLAAEDPRLAATLAGQTDLPASFAVGSLANTAGVLFGELQP